MPFEEAYKLCEEHFSGSEITVQEEIQEEGVLLLFNGNSPIDTTSGKLIFILNIYYGESSAAFIFVDKNDKVNAIIMSAGVVSHLFGVPDMDATEFAQEFLDSYKIPQFDVSDDLTRYYFQSNDNIRIEITEEKYLYIYQTQERKFD